MAAAVIADTRPMAILGIDHVIVIGRDLEVLARQYRALDFTVTPAAGTRISVIS